MPEDDDTFDYRERLRAVEVRLELTEARMSRFEGFCKETQQLYRESFSDMNNRIEKLVNHTVHDLEDQIKAARRVNRAPLTRKEWAQIIVAILTVTGGIIIAVIQAGWL